MAENAQNSEWDRILAERLAKKRGEDERAPRSAPLFTERAGEPGGPAGGGEAAEGTLLWAASPGSPDPSAWTPAGESASGAARAETVAADMRRKLAPCDEKKALDILLRRGGPGSGRILLAFGALAAFAAAGAVLLGVGGSSGEGTLHPAGDVAPPPEEPGSLARGIARVPGAAGEARAPEGPEKLPTFHARAPGPGRTRLRRRREWMELGGPLVNLDASPPATCSGP